MYYYNPYMGSYYDDFSYERKNPMMNQNDYYPVEEAFVKGNIVKSQYDQYRHYVPKMPTGKNEKESLMIMMMMYGAACHDLVLILDVTPNNQLAMDLFEQYDQKYKEAKSTYIAKYGSLSASTSKEMKGMFAYTMAKSPWELM